MIRLVGNIHRRLIQPFKRTNYKHGHSLAQALKRHIRSCLGMPTQLFK